MLRIDWVGGKEWKQENQLGYCSSPSEMDGGFRSEMGFDDRTC